MKEFLLPHAETSIETLARSQWLTQYLHDFIASAVSRGLNGDKQ